MKKFLIWTILLAFCLGLAGCTAPVEQREVALEEGAEATTTATEALTTEPEESQRKESESPAPTEKKARSEKSEPAPLPEPIYGADAYEISAELKHSAHEDLKYATEFTLDYYEGGYTLLVTKGVYRYLIVPGDLTVPTDLPEDIAVVRTREQRAFLTATGMMDMFIRTGTLDHIAFSSWEAEKWQLSAAREAMEEGKIVYAGKHSAPDYELLLAEHCQLAVCNSNIYRNPEVYERLEALGIPVFIEFSSYESEPLGRAEWVLAIGALTGEMEAAREAFAEAEAKFQEEPAPKTDLKIAFFHISSDGSVNVRKASDEMAKLIALAGGKYLFDDLGDPSDTEKTMTSIQMEEFYARAEEADILIYNAPIGGELASLEEFLALSPHLRDLPAVQAGQVYSTRKLLYQESLGVGELFQELKALIAGETEGFRYLYQLR